MEPITLFALANAAVSAVKKGCQLYKDVKSAAGDVKDVLKDLDSQFNKVYAGKPIPAEARKQLQEEKQKVSNLETELATLQQQYQDMLARIINLESK